MSLVNLTYNRNDTVAYAEKWALSRNSAYYNFDGIGGDCTNFASQCLYAGAKVMNYTPTLGWYYNNINSRSPSWSGVPYFYNFLIKNKSVGPYARECSIEELNIGDFIQLGSSERFYHTLVIIRIDGKNAPDNIYIATHTFDSLNRPLSSYMYSRSRYIHIEGVRKFN